MRSIGSSIRLSMIILATGMMLSPAMASTITGIWQQVDDESHEVRSLVQITEQNGIYEGKMIKLFPHPDELTPSDDGSTLEVRGYIGLEMMGRTQVWLRQK